MKRDQWMGAWKWLLVYIVMFTFWSDVNGAPLVIPVPLPHPQNVDWFTQGQDTLKSALNRKPNTNVAKNVILFIGDGMDLNTITAARIYAGQKEGNSGEEHKLHFEKFPSVAMSKTYNVDRQGPDSAGTASAMLTGFKVNSGTIGVNQNVKRGDCSNAEGNMIDGMVYLSHLKGKSTGVISTARMTHASVSAAYAHHSDREYEFTFESPKTPPIEPEKCGEDIATQLIRNNSYINVLMGGGRRAFYPSGTADPEYPDKMSKRKDDRNLIQEWIDDKENNNKKNAYVWNKAQFDAVDTDNTDFLLGLFEYSHMQYELDKSNDGSGEPTIVEMVEKAIKILSKNKEGFFLMVEGARIDQAHHINLAKKALDETIMLDNAIKKALDMTDDKETLIVVTGDHGHVFTMGGYTQRGNPILGLIDQNWNYDVAVDDFPYPSLYYANGPGYLDPRPNLTDVDLSGNDYVFPAGLGTDYETHGGHDVGIFANGPMSHLFHGVHEQNYIGHVMMYASCVGPNTEHCDNTGNSATTTDECKSGTVTLGVNIIPLATLVTVALGGYFW